MKKSKSAPKLYINIIPSFRQVNLQSKQGSFRFVTSTIQYCLKKCATDEGVFPQKLLNGSSNIIIIIIIMIIIKKGK